MPGFDGSYSIRLGVYAGVFELIFKSSGMYSSFALKSYFVVFSYSFCSVIERLKPQDFLIESCSVLFC